MTKHIKITQEMLIANSEQCSKIVKSWPRWKRNIFGGPYRKTIVDGKVVLSQDKVDES